MNGVRIETRDGLDLLCGLADGAAAAVVTDPPWNRHQDYGGIDDARPARVHARWLELVLDQALRVAADAVVLLPGEEHVAGLHAALARREVWWRRLNWLPPASSVRPPATLNLHDAPVLWIRHHGPPTADLSPLRTPLTADPHLAVHPCPKPTALFRELIARCVVAAGPIVDPFAGTGAVLAAARGLGRAAIGSDLNTDYCRVARQRSRRASGTHESRR